MKNFILLSRSIAICAAIVLGNMLPVHAGDTNVPFATLNVGKYFVNNNTWGKDEPGVSGWESVWASEDPNNMWWGSAWSWSGGSPYGVKAYPSIVLGWHWTDTNRPGTGLPVRINANRNVSTLANFSVTGNNVLNVAYDLWFHTVTDPNYTNPTDEVMIWLYRQNGAGPLGTFQGTVSLAGTSWDLYRGNIGWNVFSFVRRTNSTNSTINLKDFYGEVVRRGWMANTKYLTSVQFGSEIFSGNGQLNVNQYFANVQ